MLLLLLFAKLESTCYVIVVPESFRSAAPISNADDDVLRVVIATAMGALNIDPNTDSIRIDCTSYAYTIDSHTTIPAISPIAQPAHQRRDIPQLRQWPRPQQQRPPKERL
jgi:hypothetical protein